MGRSKATTSDPAAIHEQAVLESRRALERELTQERKQLARLQQANRRTQQLVDSGRINAEMQQRAVEQLKTQRRVEDDRARLVDVLEGELALVSGDRQEAAWQTAARTARSDKVPWAVKVAHPHPVHEYGTAVAELTAVMAKLVRQANDELRAEPGKALNLLGRGMYRAGQKNPRVFKMNWGHAVERRVAQLIRNDPDLVNEIKYTAGSRRADFDSKRHPAIRFDITTEGQLHQHRIRPEYGRGLTMLLQEGPGGLKAFP